MTSSVVEIKLAAEVTPLERKLQACSERKLQACSAWLVLVDWIISKRVKPAWTWIRVDQHV